MVGTNSLSAQASQTTVGGARLAAARKRVATKGATSTANSATTTRPRAQAAGANQGILKFYTEDAPGLRIGPQAVLIMALVFMGLVVMLHIVGTSAKRQGVTVPFSATTDLFFVCGRDRACEAFACFAAVAACRHGMEPVDEAGTTFIVYIVSPSGL